MARRAAMPRITPCFPIAPRRASLTDRRVMTALFVSVVLAVWGVAHIHLRFAIDDMRMQHRRLQEQYRALEIRHMTLQGETEQMSELERLGQFARYDLGMVEQDPRTRVVASVPPAVAAKYAESRSVAAADEAGAADVLVGRLPDVPGKSWLLTLVEVNQAFAAATAAPADK
jgi:cell division protein FtsL